MLAESTDISQTLSFSSFTQNSYDNFVSDSLAWARENPKLVQDDGKDQMILLVTDGMFNKVTVKKEVNKLTDVGIETVCILMDASQKLHKVKSAVKDKDGNISMKSYLDDFPFKH